MKGSKRYSNEERRKTRRREIDDVCREYVDCEVRFDDIEVSLVKLTASVDGMSLVVADMHSAIKGNTNRITEIEKKVFNGFGSSIDMVKDYVGTLSKEVKNTRNLIFTLLIMIVVGFVSNYFIQSHDRKVVQTETVQSLGVSSETYTQGTIKSTTP